jgi:hypothetical protein
MGYTRTCRHFHAQCIMLKKLLTILLILSASLMAGQSIAVNQDDIGQTIQINTRFSAFTGRPSWLLIIRDLDHNENIPYVFDVKRGENTWVVYTRSKHYLVLVSTMQFAPYLRDPYRIKKINDFCHLESHGRIQRGTSMYITLSGILSPYAADYDCQVQKYADPSFTVVND